MKWSKALSLVAMMSMAAAVTGCGSKQAEAVQTTAAAAEAGTEAAAAETSAAASGEKKVLTVSVWDNDATPQFTAVTDAFLAQHPDVDIQFIDAPSDDYNNKVTVMLAGGGADPDVIFVKDTENQMTMKDKGQILNLDEYIKKDNVDLGIYQGVADQLKMDGSNYTLPFRKDWYMLYYNKDLFDAAGVDYPSSDMTWEAYEELARKMTSGEGSSKVYGTHDHTWQALVSNWAVQDGKNTLMSDDYSFMKPYYEQALRMQKDGIMQDYANLKTGSIHYISVFEQQQCAMLPMGSWFIGTLIKDKNEGKFDFNWGVTTIPHPADTEAGATVGSTTPVAINAKTDDPDLAWEYVKFVTGEEGALALAENGIFPAASTDAINEKLAEIEGFPEDGAPALEITSWVLDRPIDAKMAAVRKVLEEEHDLIMIGEEDVDTGIENMNQRAKEAKED